MITPEAILRAAALPVTPDTVYLVTERLGILCGDAEPTQDQIQIAVQQIREMTQAGSYGAANFLMNFS